MTCRIDGRTRLAAVVGRPVAHSLSPAMHNAAYEAMGLDWVYVPLPLEDADALEVFAEAARVMPFVGFNVTMPYKRAMLDLCDEVAPFARLAGAVNTVQVVEGKLRGYNTDGRGLLEALELEAGFMPEGRRIVLLGAGGAAGGAFVSFVLGKSARVTIVNRTPGPAEEMVERLSAHLRGTEAVVLPFGEAAGEEVAAADLVVNATPLGMAGDERSPIPVEWLHAGQVVADMVYDPPVTPLLAAAEAVGAAPVGGLGMLVGQGAIAIETWTAENDQAPRDIMRASAEEALARQASSERGGG